MTFLIGNIMNGSGGHTEFVDKTEFSLPTSEATLSKHELLDSWLESPGTSFPCCGVGIGGCFENELFYLMTCVVFRSFVFFPGVAWPYHETYRTVAHSLISGRFLCYGSLLIPVTCGGLKINWWFFRVKRSASVTIQKMLLSLPGSNPA